MEMFKRAVIFHRAFPQELIINFNESANEKPRTALNALLGNELQLKTSIHTLLHLLPSNFQKEILSGMITRRDKLLTQPWQQKRYENHLRKVKSALPAIDNNPPASRQHVAIKLKHKQNEDERCTRIERDNLILLQKLNHIMRTNRVDNRWSIPQPNFLNRVALRSRSSSKELLHKPKSPETYYQESRSRKDRCYACTPTRQQEPLIPEERIPWEPEKPPVGRIRSKSVPAHLVLPTVKEVSRTSSTTPDEKFHSKKERSKTCKAKKQRANVDAANMRSPQSIILSRASLVLSVNFPSDTVVKFREGVSEKVIMQGVCHCRNVSLS